MDWTILNLLSWTESYFKKHGVDSPRLTAEILLGFCLNIRRLDLYLQYDRPMQDDELKRFKALLKRRVGHEPVAYITGTRGFYESDFSVGPGVLIPRPETELMVEKAAQFLEKDLGRPWKILELGVGSGAVIVSVARMFPSHLYFASDISHTALEVAGKNAKELLETPVHFFKGSWFEPFAETARFDMILSNPPYIPAKDIEGLAPEVKDHEPLAALDGGPDGLGAIRKILFTAPLFLAPGGVLLLEMGFDQARGVTDIAWETKAFESVTVFKDLSGLDRLFLGRV